MRNLLGILLIIFCTLPVLGQKIKTASGDISILAGEKELSVSFGYDNMNVHGYSSEEEFIKDKVRIREEHKPGSGEKFKGSWFADRDTVYAPLFIENLNYALPKKRKIVVSRSNPNAKYNLHIQTLWIYPGYNVGFSQPCKIEVALQIYEVANPKNIVWESKSPIRIEAKIAPYKREMRIGAAYGTLAMKLSWLLRKKAK
ncbi:hypothetical protein [Aquimarina sp. 2201CG14-23]|uniref:hypothetical protein n=1 Tax=Aquimarina mycalae TaxID=3040073 RepID=UPI0024780D31|nr:hypothetical protein [Aquimarina sp. 2201CG14-23]MDH7445098.1 hypothetical protein [Aquimarina sp. 2201CG14-23]